MALPTSYLTGAFNKIPNYFDAILTAKAPEKFTIKFFENLGFKSSNDRLFINVLKVLKFIDENGTPTTKYFEFLDQSQSKRVLAKGIEEAYYDLFEINKSAYNLTQKDIEGKMRTLTSGSKGDKAISYMARTFKELSNYADWTDNDNTISNHDATVDTPVLNKIDNKYEKEQGKTNFDLNYDIHIHLPATRDQAVYDALFSSLSKHINMR